MAQKRKLQRVPRREGATQLMQSVGDPEEGTIWEHVRPRKISDEDIVALELPTGAPISYELKDDLTPAKPRQALR